MNMAHIHLWLTHVPILGSIFLTILFLVALVYRNVFTQKVSLWFLGGIALLTIPTFLSGEEAEEVVEDVPGISTTMLQEHAFVSRFGLWIICLTGIIAVAGALIYRNKTMLPWSFVVVMLVLLLVNDALFAYIGFLGGQIRHQEIRTLSTSALLHHEQRARWSTVHQAVTAIGSDGWEGDAVLCTQNEEALSKYSMQKSGQKNVQRYLLSSCSLCRVCKNGGGFPCME